MKTPQNIVVFRLSAMGDVAMIVPVIREFSKQYPTVKITVVSKTFFESFFDGISNVTFLKVDLDERHKGFIGLVRLFLDLKKLKIDGFLDLHQVLRSKVVRFLCFLSGIKCANINKGRKHKKQLTRAKNKIFKPLETVFERQQKAFLQLGFPLDLSNPSYPQKAILSPEIVKLTNPKAQLKWIGIAPFAQYQSKTYPTDKLQEVVAQLALDTNNMIFLFGGATDVEQLNSISKNLNNTQVVAGKLSLKQELELISNLDVMLSMDSGNGHLAAMLGINTITLWGATHPFAGFAPFGQPSGNSLVADRDLYPLLPTSIYGKKQIKGYENVMNTISEKTIIDCIYKNLNN